MSEYIVFVRQGLYVFVQARTSDYAHAARLAKQHGGSVMFADDFHKAYKEWEVR